MKLTQIKMDLIQNLNKITSFLDKHSYGDTSEFKNLTKLKSEIENGEELDLQRCYKLLDKAKNEIDNRVILACELMSSDSATGRLARETVEVAEIRTQVKNVVDGLQRRKTGLESVVRSVKCKSDKALNDLGLLSDSV